MSVWLPVGTLSTGVDRSGVLHAVDAMSTVGRDRRYKRLVTKRKPPREWDVSCGSRVVELYLVAAQTTDGEPGALAMVWPPPARSSHGTRCRECWQAAGRKRPDAQWTSVGEVVPL